MPNGSTQCPCGALVPVTAELVGLTTQCPKCRRLLPVRAGDLKPAASRGEPQRAAPAPQPAAKPSNTRAPQSPASAPKPSPKLAAKPQAASVSRQPAAQERFDRSSQTSEPVARGRRSYLFVGTIALALITTTAIGFWLGRKTQEQGGDPTVARAPTPDGTTAGGERPTPTGAPPVSPPRVPPIDARPPSSPSPAPTPAPKPAETPSTPPPVVPPVVAPGGAPTGTPATPPPPVVPPVVAPPAGTPTTPSPPVVPPVVAPGGAPAAPGGAVAPLPRAANLDRLVEAAKRPDPEERKRAAVGLAEFLSSPDRAQRATAAEALAALRKAAAPAVPALERALSETDDGILSDIKTALAFGLSAELESKDSAVRIRALEQLAALGRAARVVGADVIRVMAHDKVKKVQTAATDALEKIDPKVHEHVATLLFGTDKYGAVSALGRLEREAEMATDLLFELVEACKNSTALVDDRLHLLETLALIAPSDKRFEKYVLESIRMPIAKNAVRTVGISNRRFGLRHIQMISATKAEKAKALTAALEDGHLNYQVIDELVTLGADAAPALPLLKKLKMSTEDGIRKVATDAVNKIESAMKP